MRWYDIFDSVSLEIYVKRENEPDVEYPYFVIMHGMWRTWGWIGCATLADLLNLCNQFAGLIRLSTETEKRVMAQQEQNDADRLRRRYGGAA